MGVYEKAALSSERIMCSESTHLQVLQLLEAPSVLPHTLKSCVVVFLFFFLRKASCGPVILIFHLFFF